MPGVASWPCLADARREFGQPGRPPGPYVPRDRAQRGRRRHCGWAAARERRPASPCPSVDDTKEKAMSTARDNLEVVVAWLDAMRRADLAAVEAVLESTVVWRGLPAGAVCHDRDEVLDMLRADELREGLRSIWALELVAGESAVVLGVRSPGLDPIGDVAPSRQLFNVFAIRGGRIAAIQDYATRADALRAAGAEEPGRA